MPAAAAPEHRGAIDERHADCKHDQCEQRQAIHRVDRWFKTSCDMMPRSLVGRILVDPRALW